MLELGCGLGRFTGPMLELGLEVTATDISPELVRSLAERLGGRPGLTVVAAPAEELGDQVEGGFDAVVGFFFLHHLRRLEPVLGVCRRLLRPGGRLAFCEPNGLNPLYYLQVTLTPGMSWRGEPGVPKMRPRVVLPALQAAGFERTAHSSYGFLPPRLAMTRPGRRIERVLETSQALRGLRAYRVFAAGSAA